MPTLCPTTRHPLRARASLRMVAATLLLVGLAGVAFAEHRGASWARLVLADDAVAACAGVGRADATPGATVHAGATIDASGGATAPSYWNPVARVGGTVLGGGADYAGCWFDATVEVRTFQRSCTFAATATLFVGEQRLAAPVARTVRADEVTLLTFRSRIASDTAMVSGAPVFVDVQLVPARGGCPG